MVNSKELPGSPNVLMRVLASDGFHTAAALVARPLQVTRKAPQALILAPEDRAALDLTRGIVLEGKGSDYEEDVIPDEVLTWRSDQDGVLGVGRQGTVARLWPGVHTITLTAKDREGWEGQASVTVRVAAPMEISSEPGLEGSVDNAGRVDTKGGITVGNGPKAGEPPREQVVRGFVSFDLTQLPRNVEILQARLELSQKDITGDPYFKGLGAVTVDAVEYGSSLDAEDFQAPILIEAIGTLSDNGLLEIKGLDVTEAVKTALAKGLSRVQFRSSGCFWRPSAEAQEPIADLHAERA